MNEANHEETKGTSGGPVPPMDRIRHEMERWLEVARTTSERALESLGLVASGRPAVPAIDVIEFESEIMVLVELPGIAAESVKLSIVGNMLTVTASRPATEYSAPCQKHVSERMTTCYERPIPLPAAVEQDGIRAETRDGLLTVLLRKSVTTSARSIPVGRAPSSPKPPENMS